MASFYGHISTAVVLGAAYGSAGAWYGHFDWGVVVVAFGMTALGGMTPDLDSDSGVPLRELFAVGSAIFPLFLIPRLRRAGFTFEQILAIFMVSYVTLRYGVSDVFRKISVHRGIFHSVPAMLVASLVIFNVFHNDNIWIRIYIAGGMLVGFLSHLVLDEVFAVDLEGVTLKKSFGTAVKFYSDSWSANIVCYTLLAALGSLAWKAEKEDLIQVRDQIVRFAQK